MARVLRVAISALALIIVAAPVGVAAQAGITSPKVELGPTPN